MIIVRTPLRLSIVGGGTDLPSWYKEHGSLFVSATISKYIYTTVHRSEFNKNIRVRYSKMEEVENVNDIQNEIVRETLKYCGIDDSIEITSHAEVPSGTGLGSSGAFGVSLVHALKPEFNSIDLSIVATDIQMNILKYPIGIQDQVATAFGGLNVFKLGKYGETRVEPIIDTISDNLCLFYTGIKRDTNEVLKASSDKGLDKIQELAFEFLRGASYGEILKEHWEFKKQRGGMTNPQIDEWYTLALKNGMIGGKIVGAGGGGFLLAYTEDREKLIKAMPLQHVDFKFEYEGSKIILND